jgi:hypothetical protein
MILEGNTIQEAIETLSKLRRWAPYRFGGKWFLAMIEGEVWAFRTKKPLLNRAIKAGMQSLDMISVGNKTKSQL